MDIAALIIAFELFILSTAAIGAFFLIKRISGEDDSDTIIIVRDGSRTEQKVIGSLINKTTGRNGRLHFTMIPKDSIDQKPILIIAEPNKVIPYPKNGWSGEKNIIEILPNSAQDYISNLISNIEQKNAESHIINAQREGINRQASHLKDIGEGELSDVSLGLMKEFEGKLLKSQVKDEMRRSPNSYPTASDTFRV